MDLTPASAGQAIADVPIGTMIADLGLGIAAAQRALDVNSINAAVALMNEKLTVRGEQKSLLELGFTPAFYYFSEATLDVNVSVTMRVAQLTTFGLGVSIGSGGSIAQQKPPSTEKPAAEKPAEEKPAEEQPAEEQPAEEKPAP